MKRAAVFLGALALMAGALLAGGKPTSANHAWGSYHWARTTAAFTLQLGDSVSSVWDPHLNAASADWTSSSVLDTTIVAGKGNPRTCRPTAGRVEVCNSTYGNNGWLGIAQIWTSGSHIVQGTVKNNDTYFNTPAYNKPEWRQFVMCQEIGHTFGLSHQDEAFNNPNLGSCMDYTNDPKGGSSGGSLSNLSPNQHDFDQLATIYGHSDSSSTVGTAPAGGGPALPPAASGDLDDPSQWGRLVRASRDGRLQLYERDFGRGVKVFTFVIRA